MSISKKIRFEVFKRDGFTCVYCGRTPPEVMLEVDHIEPKSAGGTDDINNLVTSCFDCNRGKTNIRLDKIPGQLKENLEVLEEKENQLKEYQKHIRKIERRIKKDIEKINDIYNSYFEDYVFSDRFKNATLKTFLKHLPVNEIIDALHIACSKKQNADDTIPYFCGICWNKIKGIKPWWEKESGSKIQIINLWKELSAEYGRGSGWYSESEVKEIKDLPMDMIKKIMIYAYTSPGRVGNYWNFFMEVLREEIEREE